MSGADKAGVERSRDRRILGTFEDGATVGEDGHFVGWDAETQKKFVVTDGFDRGCKTRSKRREVERARTLVNLDRIPTAHGDMGLGFPFKVRKLAPGTGAAIGIAFDLDGLKAAGPDISRDKTTVKSVLFPCKEFECFGGFERRDELDYRSEDADGVAGLFDTGRHMLAGLKQTGETGGDARADGHGDAVTAYGGGINPRAIVFDGKVIHEESGFEIVGTVENEVKACE